MPRNAKHRTPSRLSGGNRTGSIPGYMRRKKNIEFNILKRKPAIAKGGRPLLGGTAAAKGRYIWSSQERVHDVDDPSRGVDRTERN